MEKNAEILKEKKRESSTEGGLVCSIIHYGYNKGVTIISYDTGQFNVFLHVRFWACAGRMILKLISFTKKNIKLLEDKCKDIWKRHRCLKEYRINSDEAKRQDLERPFEELFARKIKCVVLDQALKRIYQSKTEFLSALEKPNISLYSDLSENDIREYVKRRKISVSVRSDTGKICRDIFTSLKKTCRKLGLSFWDYLMDRIRREEKIFNSWEIMALKMSNAYGLLPLIL
ncbi:MAG: hypothetical protein V6Z89_05570 [Desulfobacter sp.]